MRVLLFLITALVIFGLPIFFLLRQLKIRTLNKESLLGKGSWWIKSILSGKMTTVLIPRISTLFILRPQTDGEVKINVTKNVYDDWKTGDKAEKTEGQLLPKKVA